MADQNVASDMSGRPIRRPTVAEAIAEFADGIPEDMPSWDMFVVRDGVKYADTGGKFYPLLEDGEPDWSRPISDDDFEKLPPRKPPTAARPRRPWSSQRKR